MVAAMEAIEPGLLRPDLVTTPAYDGEVPLVGWHAGSKGQCS